MTVGVRFSGSLHSGDKVVAIHQPNFLPRLKVLQKLAAADVWIVLDSVKYAKREWQNRTRIVPVHNPEASFWLTIPVHRPNGEWTRINEVVVADLPGAVRKIHKSLFHAFHKARYWGTIQELLRDVRVDSVSNQLVDIDVKLTLLLLRIAGKRPKIIYSSTLQVSGKGSSLIASICKYVNATIYLSDSGGMNYMQPEHFKGLKVMWQRWREPPERWPGIFSWRNISSLNYLARVGPEKFSAHLTEGEFVERPEFDLG